METAMLELFVYFFLTYKLAKNMVLLFLYDYYD